MEGKLIDGKMLTRETVVEQYKALVFKYAHRLSGGDYHAMEDLAQEGFIGLLQAFDRYDEKKGIRFMTFASSYVNGFTLRANQKRGVLYTPINVLEVAWKIERLGLWDRADKEIAEKLKIKESRVDPARIYFSRRKVGSLDRMISDDSEKGNSFYECNSYNDDFSEAEGLEYLKTLNKRELFIIKKMLEGYEQTEISRMLGFSKQTIWKTLSEAKRKVSDAISGVDQAKLGGR